jgi:hypothetical protein
VCVRKSQVHRLTRIIGLKLTIIVFLSAFYTLCKIIQDAKRKPLEHLQLLNRQRTRERTKGMHCNIFERRATCTIAPRNSMHTIVYSGRAVLCGCATGFLTDDRGLSFHSIKRPRTSDRGPMLNTSGSTVKVVPLMKSCRDGS